MGVGYNPRMITNGLDIALDVNNTKSYSGAGSTWYNLINGADTETTNNTWGNGATSFSIFCFINVLGNDTSYAYHPINKWNTGTTDASFVLYHFQDFPGSSIPNRFNWYANRGGVWGGISDLTPTMSLGHHFIGLQYNSTTGGIMWIDGAPYGSRQGSGAVGSGSGYVTVSGGPDAQAGIHHVKCAYFYNRELSDSEMRQNFNALRGRFGI